MSEGTDQIPGRAVAWRRWLPLAAWAAFVAALSIVHVADPDGPAATPAYYTVTTAAGVLACWAAARRRSDDRRTAVLIAAGLAANAVAELTYEVVYRVTGTPPDVSIADAFWMLSYVFIIAGMLRRSAGRRATIDVDGLLDVVSFGVIAFLLVGDVANLGKLFETGSGSLGVRLVFAAYPALDLALLAVLVRAVVGGSLRGRTGAVLAGGVGAWLVSDFGFAFTDGGTGIPIFDIGWMVGAAALAAAVAAPRGEWEPVQIEPRTVRTGRILINLVPLLLPIAIETVSYTRDVETNPLPLAVATVVLVACAALRATRLARARDEHQRRLAEREHYFQVIADNSSDAVVVVDREGRLLRGSPQLATMSGHPELAEVGSDMLLLHQPARRDAGREMLRQMWDRIGVLAEKDGEFTDADGRPLWLRMRVVNLRDDPTIGGIVINFCEITARKLAEQAFTHQAFHDVVTGLPNRALFRRRVERALEVAAGNPASVAVVFLDLDRFKAANDRFGHPAGDALLREVGERLTAALAEAGSLARLGGDEFAILITSPGEAIHDAIAAAERVTAAMALPFELHGAQLTLSGSIGIAVAGTDASEATLLRDADIAMYQSKARGSGHWTVYDDAMRAAAVEQFELELDVAMAVEQGQLWLAYHPIVRTRSGTVVGFEALVRWSHPTRGTVVPTSFIPIAERTGAIEAIGDWVLDEACRTAAQWHRRWPNIRPAISVNISAHQLADHQFAGNVAAALTRSGLDPCALILEVTESALVEDADSAASRLAELRELGVRVAVDDFGTGYSSFSYLSQLPVDMLKLDQSFVRQITAETTPPIVRGLLELTRTLDLEVVAEGVEDEFQLDGLRAERCEYAQGYLFAQPLSADRAADLIARAAGQSAAKVIPLTSWKSAAAGG